MEPADKAKVAAPGRRVEMLSRYSTARVGVQAFHYRRSIIRYADNR